MVGSVANAASGNAFPPASGCSGGSHATMGSAYSGIQSKSPSRKLVMQKSAVCSLTARVSWLLLPCRTCTSMPG